MTEPYVVAVTGGRHYGDRAHVFRVLNEIHRNKPVTLIVQGYASGADDLAMTWAESRGVPHTGSKYAAPWYVTGRLDRSAGPRRNRRMLEQEGAHLLVAFPGGTGTNGCVRIGRELGIQIRDERTI
jgi:YspA, cpYpsA-related SLOG family